MKHTLFYIFLLAILNYAGQAQVRKNIGVTAAKGDCYALIIGISKYPNLPKENQLDASVIDAKNYKQFLTSAYCEAGMDEHNIMELYNSSATQQGIINALTTLCSKAKPNSIIYFFYSGHGMPKYIVPSNATTTSVASLINYEYIFDKLKNCNKFRNKVIILDACYSGSASYAMKGMDAGEIKEAQDRFFKEKEQAKEGWVVFASCSATNTSEQTDDLNSLFTRKMIEGLKCLDGNCADGNNNKLVTATELKTYLSTTLGTSIPPAVYGNGDFPMSILAGGKLNNGPDNTTPPQPPRLATAPIEMVYVQGGTFQMGDANSEYSYNKPVHSVTLNSFSIGKYEVTQKQWREVMGTSPSGHKNCDDCPVETVSWNEVHEFLDKLNERYPGHNYRLPTEAEWEYAAKGGVKNYDYAYSGGDDMGDVGWFTSNSGNTTHAVGTAKKGNSLGIYDMSGNVWEWCEDWYGNYSAGAQTNPTGASTASYRVLRGGSWIDVAVCCRSSFRSHGTPGYPYILYGFRVVIPQ